MPCVHQSGGAAENLPAATCTAKSVEPYISMRSPGSRTPTLSASAQASIVPAKTGVPGRSPVAAAAAAVTAPTCSPGQTSLGSGQPGSTSATQSSAHPRAARS